METPLVPVIAFRHVCVSCETTIRNFSRGSFRLNQVFIFLLLLWYDSRICHSVCVCVVWGVTHIWGIDVGLIFRTHKPLPQRNNTMHADLTQSIDGSLSLVKLVENTEY